MRLWGGSAFGVGGTRKLRLRVPSPVARLGDRGDINQCPPGKPYFSKMSQAHTSPSSSKRVEADTIRAETGERCYARILLTHACRSLVGDFRSRFIDRSIESSNFVCLIIVAS